MKQVFNVGDRVKFTKMDDWQGRFGEGQFLLNRVGIVFQAHDFGNLPGSEYDPQYCVRFETSLYSEFHGEHCTEDDYVPMTLNCQGWQLEKVESEY